MVRNKTEQKYSSVPTNSYVRNKKIPVYKIFFGVIKVVCLVHYSEEELLKFLKKEKYYLNIFGLPYFKLCLWLYIREELL